MDEYNIRQRRKLYRLLAHTPEGRKTTLKMYTETGVLNKMDL